MILVDGKTDNNVEWKIHVCSIWESLLEPQAENKELQ